MNNLAKKMRALTRDYEKMLHDWASDTFKKRSRLQLETQMPDFSDEQMDVLRSLGYIK